MLETDQENRVLLNEMWKAPLQYNPNFENRIIFFHERNFSLHSVVNNTALECWVRKVHKL